MPLRLYFLSLLLIIMGVWPLGCRKRAPVMQAEVSDFKLGNMIADTTVPPFDELEATVAASGGWQPGRITSGLEILREKQQSIPITMSDAEALALRNDSDEHNTTIKQVLGRLPANDSEVDYQASVTLHAHQTLKSTNPLLASSVTEAEVSGLFSFGLFNFDDQFTTFAVQDHVESWESSADGLYDKVILRKDLTWSDGTPVTAHDVEFTFRVIMTEEIPIPAIRQGPDKLKMVKAYDDHTVVFFHQEATAINHWNILWPIIPKHIYERTIPVDPTMMDSDEHVALNQKPVSCGPYEFVKSSPSEIILRRSDSYFTHNGQPVRDKPYFESVRYRITPDASTALLELKTGDIDKMVLEAAQWSTTTGGDDFYAKNTKARAVEWVSFSFFWNTKSSFFEDVRVREAMSAAFDHGQMLETLRYGRDEPCTGTYHRTSRWHPGPNNAVKNAPQPQVQDTDRAKALLDAAGWVDSDGDGYRDKEVDGQVRKFEFTILVLNAKERIDICSLLQQNLRPLGISCKIRPLEMATLQDKTQRKEFDATFGGWGTGADPDTSENIFGTGKDRNFGSYSNPIVDEMFAEGRKLKKDRKPWKELQLWQDQATRDYLGIDASLAEEQPQREDCYAVIQAVLWRDKPYTWLFYRNAYYAFSKRLRGYNFSPRGPFSFSPGFGSVWAAKTQ